MTDTTPRVVQGTIETSIQSLFRAARPIVDIVDLSFAELLKEQGIEDPTTPEASEFFMSQDMDKFYADIAKANPEKVGLLLETVALLIGSITVSRAIED